ncbi:hypothetical protein NTE_02993 [Candidatus Nitrososphaera evergladensis SR1]|uniref:Sce7726 family protein n=1 Tax=Candidatus Nitrososphaera evergladensis SR1 TaxID=1459636 RepID=A0A075MV42_9ARCH|nr:hypothetical protein [Candidatus Nitrososphaera evergladensis]AIF85028.1 hypothetical protein NTE_02993 [Candidatus Nitrososphaera evergladensis SR1]
MIRGIHEVPLISVVEDYFRIQGFTTYPHATLNIAWSNIVSDVDVLAIKEDQVIAIEVKSKKDVFEKAFTQLKDIAPFVDRTFIATDDEVKANKYRNSAEEFGILYLDLVYDETIVKKKPRAMTTKPSIKQICYLRRCCLEELARGYGIPPHQSKQYIALDLLRLKYTEKLRTQLKQIVALNRQRHLHSSNRIMQLGK